MEKELTQEFYKRLYGKMTEDAEEQFEHADVEGGFTEFQMEVEVDGLTVYISATYKAEFVDDSFDHAFGTCHQHHYELGNLTAIAEVYVYDGDDSDISSRFSEDDFWKQFKKYGLGDSVKPGDKVLVKFGYRPCEEWLEAEYLYTDLLSCRHVCRLLNGRPISQSFKYIKPCA